MRSLFIFISALLFSFTAYGVTPWIHPGVKEAIEKPAPDYIIVNGVKQFTGYHPSKEQYEGANFDNFSGHRGEEIPDEYDMRKFTNTPMRRQVAGDCWAQGGTAALEYTVSWLDKISTAFSVQDVIECSGFGSARGGGQISVSYFEKDGIAEAADYPYTGRDGRCRNDVKRTAKVRSTGYLRGTDGKAPTWPDFQIAVMKTGALEICGSASALGNGGWVEGNRGGSTNHCYTLVGWLDGAKNGKKAGSYAIVHNSWGDQWGDKGFGYYLLTTDGVNLRGSVITESKWIDYKDPLPPGPVEFEMTGSSKIKVVVQPGKYRADKVKSALERAGFKGVVK